MDLGERTSAVTSIVPQGPDEIEVEAEAQMERMRAAGGPPFAFRHSQARATSRLLRKRCGSSSVNMKVNATRVPTPFTCFSSAVCGFPRKFTSAGLGRTFALSVQAAV